MTKPRDAHDGWNLPNPESPRSLDEGSPFRWHWQFDEPIYQRTINLIYCPPTDHNRALRGLGAPEHMRVEGERPRPGVRGAAMWWNNEADEARYCIWIAAVDDLPRRISDPDLEFYGTLFHECLHTMQHVLYHVGQSDAMTCVSGHESMAYYGEFIFRRVLYYLRDRAIQEFHAREGGD